MTNPGGLAFSRDQRMGGDGWFGTVGIGYDWQFNGPWVAGIFGDGQFGNIRGSISDPFFGVEGRQKLETSYAAGVRVGYLVAPNVLSYVNGGYSGSEWSGASYSTLAAGGGPTLFTTPSFQRNGWFVGGGVENNLDIFGIRAPGWFMKTEYRSAFYDRVTLPDDPRRRRHHRQFGYLQALGADRQHLAGLPLQLGPLRPDLSRTDQLESPGICRGFFVFLAD